LKDEIDKAVAARDAGKAEQLQQQLANERKKLKAELGERKEQVRTAGKGGAANR